MCLVRSVEGERNVLAGGAKMDPTEIALTSVVYQKDDFHEQDLCGSVLMCYGDIWFRSNWGSVRVEKGHDWMF